MVFKVEQGKENKILRTVSNPVREITPEIKRFAVDMTKTMEAERGVGIAAPQCGRNIRMAIVKLNPGEKNEIIFPIINPEIVDRSQEVEAGEEGCLSLPGLWGKIKRHTRVVLRYKDLKNQEQTLELHDFNARIIQHEVDHLNGTLYVDNAYDLEEKKRARRKE